MCQRKGTYRNIGKRLFLDRNCRDRCDKDSSCTGYMLGLYPTVCATYTLAGLTGDGKQTWRYDCWMKGKQ